jgi:site-specific DNA recombinase
VIITNAKNRYGASCLHFVCVGRHQKRTGCTRKAVLISVLEELVEGYWADVPLALELRARIETMVGEELKGAQDLAETANRQLTARRQQLTQ